MFTAKLIFITIIMPALISFVIQFFYKKGTNDYSLGNILGLMFGSLTGYFLILGLPQIPPADLNQTIFYQFIFIGLISLIVSFLNSYKKYLLELSGLILLSFSAIYPLYQGLGLNKSIVFSLIICFLGITYNYILDNLKNKFSDDKNKIVILIIFTMISCVTSAILFMSGSALLSQFTGAIMASLAITFPILFLKKDYYFSNSSFYFYLSFHLLMCFLGYYLLDIPVWIISLITISPLSLIINYSKKIQSLKPLFFIMTNIIVGSVPLLIPLIKTIIDYSSTEAFF